MENVQKFEDYFETYDTKRGNWWIRQTRHDTDDCSFLVTYDTAKMVWSDIFCSSNDEIFDLFDYLVSEYGFDDFVAFCKREGYEERDGYEGYKTGEYDDSDDVIYYYIIERYPFEQWFKDYNDCVFSNIEFVPAECWNEEFNEPKERFCGYATIIFDEELKKLL